MTPRPPAPAPLATTLEFAQQVFAKLSEAVNAVQDGNIPVQDLGMHDAINDPDPRFRDESAVFSAVGTPGDPGYISIFNGFAIMQIGGVQYQLNQQLGPLAMRNSSPDMAQGDKNYVQQGHGADTVNEPVPGCKISFKLAPSQGGTPGVATPYYGAPGSFSGVSS